MWALVGCIAAATIVGLPWAKACFTLARFTLAPFGRELVSRRAATGKTSFGTTGFGTLANIIWFIFAGLWLLIIHVSAAAVTAISIIGLPFAWAHLKLAGAAIAPVGKIVVSKSVATQIEQERAADRLARMRAR